MYCKNCGAEYENDLAECPYCGAENYKKSVEEHRKVVNDYQQKTQNIRMLPQRVSRKAVKLVGIFLIAIVVIAIVGSFIVGKVQEIESEREYKERMGTLEELEELYQAGEYLELYRMWQEDRYDGYRGAFAKYWRVGDLANHYEECLDGVEDDIELALMAEEIGMSNGEECLSTIGYCILGMTYCKQYESEDYPYGEEDGVIYYYEKSMAFLKEYFLLTEEEIEQGIDYYTEENEFPTYLYETSYERLKAQGDKDSEM